MSPPSIVAGITVFKPRPDLLRALLSALVEEGLPVLVHVDGPVHQAISPDLLQELSGHSGVRLSQSQRNDGLGAALGRLTGTAAAMGFEDIILFDQDTTVTPGLTASLQAARARLRAAGARPAIVGPSPVAPRDEPSKPPRYRRRSSVLPVGPLVPVDYVITSGSLLCLAAFRDVGPFRSDYRIDGIDTEWCFRAWSKGWSVWCHADLPMTQRVGVGILRLGPLRFPLQSESRMMTYIRNQSDALRLRHVPLRWKVRLAVYLPLQILAYSIRSPDALGMARRLLAAAWAGLNGRTGG